MELRKSIVPFARVLNFCSGGTTKSFVIFTFSVGGHMRRCISGVQTGFVLHFPLGGWDLKLAL